ncbi:hypothetical protein BBO99_00002772 [Phytophthora kernoviae]|uniref:Uncharacterized protein n=1 Tax=Phytophthora kernoviae TaxID=325452 RepID=A0A3R7IEQ9_9STRA|nr:hypothetical protein BBI17_003546 [Phytophthora kernoviae]RLN82635.1 hypothetical protein BBO99_00002772 [Phytophthora kernoviae]
MLPKCKNLNNDLIIWHGMSTQNISVSVRQGLSFALRRRKIWLGIIEVEVNKKNKSIVGQVYLVWRREALLQTNTSADFVACIEQAHVDWLPNDKLEAFWSKCVGMHTQAFLDMYMEQTLRMRLKAVTIARQRDCRQSLPEQLQRDIFHYANYSWIGFDVDHTLVEYRLPYLLQTSFSQAAKDLQKDFVVLRTIPLATWLPSITQRGIAVDTARGNFLHIGEDGSIKRAYHGSHEISYFSFNVLYGDTETSDGGGNSVCSFANSSKMMYLYTAADIIYAPLYAWMVDAFDTGVITREELETSLYLVPDIEQQPPGNPDDPFLANKTVYVSLSTFVLKAARSFYAGTFWKMIISTPDLLIQPNADIVSFLDMLKTSFGRQLFVLTNGSWTHCNTVMQFAVGRNWMKYFDLVVTEANKEVFFDEFNVLPFSELDAQSVANNDTSARRVQKKLVTKLSRHKIYAHGNVKTLMTFFSENAWHPTSTNLIVEKGQVRFRDIKMQLCTCGLTQVGHYVLQRICYFGDHLMQDVYLPARHTTTWDLVAIVKEIQNLGQPAEVVQPGGRYSSSIELIALPKRVIAKIRSMENSL